METGKNMEECLWDYIDGTCNAQERDLTEQRIAGSNVWKEKYIELLEVHQLMQAGIEVEQPSMRFTKNVMDKIEGVRIAPAAKTYINKKLVTGMAIFFGLLITGLLVYSFLRIDWNDTAKVSVEWGLGKYIPAALDIFLLGNILLLFMLMDKYFASKKRLKKLQ